MDGTQASQVRKKKNLTQAQFWAKVGITQCGGCRYEGGRRVPKPVAMLLDIAHGTAKEKQAALAKLDR